MCLQIVISKTVQLYQRRRWANVVRQPTKSRQQYNDIWAQESERLRWFLLKGSATIAQDRPCEEPLTRRLLWSMSDWHQYTFICACFTSGLVDSTLQQVGMKSGWTASITLPSTLEQSLISRVLSPWIGCLVASRSLLKRWKSHCSKTLCFHWFVGERRKSCTKIIFTV